jgi:ribosomal protein S18 acetylase RimI-like enzyme
VLVEAALGHLSAEGCLAVDLAVNVRNEAALALYRGAGWRPLYSLLRRDLLPGGG